MTRWKNYKKVISAILVVAIMISLVSVTGFMEYSETEKELSYSLVELQALTVENSVMVQDLKAQLKTLKNSRNNFNEGMAGLLEIYNLLPRYRNLGVKESKMNEDQQFIDYVLQDVVVTNLGMELAGVEARLLELNGILVGEQTADEAAEILALEARKAALLIDIGAETVTLAGMEAGIEPADKALLLTGVDYLELQQLKAIFTAFDMPNPNVTEEQEYNTFVGPIYVMGSEMNAGVSGLRNGITSAEVGLKSGVAKLFQGIITTEKYYAMQLESEKIKKNDLGILKKKYDKGLVSKKQVFIAEKELKIAQLESIKMQRDLENLEMSLKDLAGIPVNVKLILKEITFEEIDLDDFSDYLESALENRTEIVGAKARERSKRVNFSYIKNYFDERDYEYKVALSENEQERMKLELVEKEVEENITYGYNDVKNKRDQVTTTKLDYESTKNQRNELRKQYDLGFVSENTIAGFKILELQKEIAYKNAIVDYMMAVSAFEYASQSGPSYQ